jgi:hypothetical protein
MRVSVAYRPVYSLFVAAFLVPGCADRSPAGVEPALTITPASSFLEVPQRRSAEIPVIVGRAAFSGPVVLRAEELPPGIRADSIVVAADESGGVLTLHADRGAVLGEFEVRVRGDSPGLSSAAVLWLHVLPAPEPATTCAGSGGTIHGGIVSGVWERLDGPHRLVDHVIIRDSLVVEAGALVCADPGVQIRDSVGVSSPFTVFRAAGSAELPVRLVAARPGTLWGGIRGGYGQGLPSQVHTQMSVHLTHAEIEDADVGAFAGAIHATHSTVRRSAGIGLGSSHGALILSDVLVESACMIAAACHATVVGSYGSAELTRVVIRDSGGTGFFAANRTLVELEDIRIEGSQGVGLVLTALAGQNSRLTRAQQPIRITRGSSYPASINVPAAGVLLSAAGAENRLLGNARDTLVVSARGYGTIPHATIRPQLPWLMMLTGYFTVEHVGTLHMLPGSSLRLQGSHLFLGGIIADGTAEAPLRIAADSVAGMMLTGLGATGNSRLEHVDLARMFVGVNANHSAELRHVSSSDGMLWFNGTTTVEKLFMRGTLPPLGGIFQGSRPARVAVHVAGRDVRIEVCDISGVATDAILTSAVDGVRIRDCNLHGNAGAAVRNDAAAPVDARHNWWGSSMGPLGPGGDGVSGAVTFEPFRTHPVPPWR